MDRILRDAITIAKGIRSEPICLPPSSGTRPTGQNILPHALVQNTRGYIERVVFQINGCYEHGWYDSCAVMMRRLLETLIIECFEAHGIAGSIQNSTGDFLPLADLITAIFGQASWNLSRATKRALPKLKSIGDQSAHNRRYNAHREDIDKLCQDFRTTCQELLYLAKLK
jgi:hypothetical protein